MTRDQLCSEIAKRENKKVSISIGNVREVIRILIEMQIEHNKDDEALIDQSPMYILLEEVQKKEKAKEKKALAKK